MKTDFFSFPLLIMVLASHVSTQEPSNERNGAELQEESVHTVTVQKGDTLSDISSREYGEAGLWKFIFAANRDKLSDPDQMRVGMQLTIPYVPEDTRFKSEAVTVLTQDHPCESPHCVAARLGHRNVVKQLLEEETDRGKINKHDIQALAIAHRDGLKHIERMLLNFLKERFQRKSFDPFDERKEKNVKHLIEQLGADTLSARRKATNQLRKMGPGVMYYLKQHRTREDLSIRYRVRFLLDEIAQKTIMEHAFRSDELSRKNR